MNIYFIVTIESYTEEYICFQNAVDVLLHCSLHHSTTAGNVETFSAHDVLINIHPFLDICHSVLYLFVGHVSVRFGIQVPLSLLERQAVLRLSQPYIQPAMTAGKYTEQLVFFFF
jgi:hypothetical protein